jgi:hypothetical protein
VIIAIFVINTVSGFPLPFAAYNGDSTTCNTFIEQTVFNLVYSWVFMTLNFLIPFGILSVFNCLIIHAIRQSRQTLQDFRSEVSSCASVSLSEITPGSNYSINTEPTLSSTNQNIPGSVTDISFVNVATLESKTSVKKEKTKRTSKSSRTTESQITRMFFTVTFSFLILTLPFYFRSLFFVVYGVENIDPNLEALWLVVARTMLYSNYSANFYLYIAVSTKFRQHVKELFKVK